MADRPDPTAAATAGDGSRGRARPARRPLPLVYLRRCCSSPSTINYVDRQVIGILKPTLQK